MQYLLAASKRDTKGYVEKERYVAESDFERGVRTHYLPVVYRNNSQLVPVQSLVRIFFIGLRRKRVFARNDLPASMAAPIVLHYF
jgi:hypothetical protein